MKCLKFLAQETTGAINRSAARATHRPITPARSQDDDDDDDDDDDARCVK